MRICVQRSSALMGGGHDPSEQIEWWSVHFHSKSFIYKQVRWFILFTIDLFRHLLCVLIAGLWG